MRKHERVLDDDLPFEEPTAEWFLPELRANLREHHMPEDFGLLRLAEFPETVRRRRQRRRRVSPQLARAPEGPQGPHWPDAA
jgi:hypothetical protein